MSDFNPSTPAVRGMEWRPTSQRSYVFDSAPKGLAQRFRSPGAVTVDKVDTYLSSLVGSPGIAVEIVDTLTPYQSVITVYPGTNTGATATGTWVDETGAGYSYTKVAKQSPDTTYLRTTFPQLLLFRGTASALTGQRIVSVTVKARVAGDAGGTIEACLSLGGTFYYGPTGSTGQFNGPFTAMFSGLATLSLATYGLNPATGLPWTQAQVNNLIGGTDSFGIFANDAGSTNVVGLWIEVVYVAENRHGYQYQTTTPGQGWTEYTLGSTSALTANTWYWLVIYGFGVTAAASATTNVLADPSVIYATGPSSSAGEHRQLTEVTIGNGGVGVASTTTVGEMVPFLLEISGTVQTQSQPYAGLASILTGSFQVSIGQTVTTAAGATTYGALKLVVGWQDPNNRPDAPLNIDIRHGGGMLTGGGTLDTTVSVQPGDLSSGTMQVIQYPAVFTSQAGATQYALYMTSAASSGRGWAIGTLDTRSDNLSTGTTVAYVEGTSQGGTTDSYFAFGTAYTRQDLPASILVAPAAPGSSAATPIAATLGTGANGAPFGLVAPHVDITWAATSLTTAFQEYRVYRRPARLPVSVWSLVGRVTVPSGYTAATVEAQHTIWTDWQAGWSVPGAEWADGWDYTVTVVNAATGVESALSTLDVMNPVPPDNGWWVTSNSQPWLNFPIVATELSGQDASGLTNVDVVGRDANLSRTRLELPMRSYQVGFQDFSRRGEDPIRSWRAAAALGTPMALLGPRGDRAIGALDNPSTLTHDPDGRFTAKGTFAETQRTSPVADFNQPAGIVLNGSTQFVDTPTNTLLNGSGGFTVFCAAAFANTASYALTRGDLLGSTTQYYGFGRPASNTMQFGFKGATTAGLVNDANAVWYDGRVHVAVGTSTGTAQALYRDGTLANAAAVTHGAISNTSDLYAGAGSGIFMALTPLRAWGFYPRTLTATETQNLSYYLLGYPGYRPPAGANLFYDLRDARCWNGTGVGTTISDLSGNGLTGTVINGPATRGVPQPFVLLDRFG